MRNEAVFQEIEVGNLIQSVDRGRPATSTLSVPALPAHATSLRAFPGAPGRGGTAELAGTSTTTTVSVIAVGPLTPGVTYEFWLVGNNFRGDGPECNHVTHALPEGP